MRGRGEAAHQAVGLVGVGAGALAAAWGQVEGLPGLQWAVAVELVGLGQAVPVVAVAVVALG
ncbi:hypothetical protein [Parvibium lacunae]|uniref:hypothetical protein n=1 Tax=Parvibium lacunae TaxID=1888893 RepID=UPI001EFCA183|nr:hypothetical protein [Parvibium lacunae]